MKLLLWEAAMATMPKNVLAPYCGASVGYSKACCRGKCRKPYLIGVGFDGIRRVLGNETLWVARYRYVAIVFSQVVSKVIPLAATFPSRIFLEMVFPSFNADEAGAIINYCTGGWGLLVEVLFWDNWTMLTIWPETDLHTAENDRALSGIVSKSSFVCLHGGKHGCPCNFLVHGLHWGQ